MHIQRPNSLPTNKIWAQSKSNETPWWSIFLKQSLPRTHTFSSQTTKSPFDVLSNCYSLSFNCDQPKPESQFSLLKTHKTTKHEPSPEKIDLSLTRRTSLRGWLAVRASSSETERRGNRTPSLKAIPPLPKNWRRPKKLPRTNQSNNNKLLSSTSSSYKYKVFSSVLRSKCSRCCCGCEEKWDGRRTNPREQQYRSGSPRHHWQWRSRLGCQTGLLPARREHVRRAGPERGPSAKPQPSEGD